MPVPAHPRVPFPPVRNAKDVRKILQAKEDRKTLVRNVVAQFVFDVLTDATGLLSLTAKEQLVLEIQPKDESQRPYRHKAGPVPQAKIESAESDGRWRFSLQLILEVAHQIADPELPYGNTSKAEGKCIPSLFTLEDAPTNEPVVRLIGTVGDKAVELHLPETTDRRGGRGLDDPASRFAQFVVDRLLGAANDGWPVVDLSKVLS